MNRCIIIKANNIFGLEDEINEFIKDLKVVSISMNIQEHKNFADCYYACIKSLCKIYKDRTSYDSCI